MQSNEQRKVDAAFWLISLHRNGKAAVGASLVDAKPKDGKVHTKGVWFYDLRTYKHCTLKTRTLKLDDLQNFIHC